MDIYLKVLEHKEESLKSAVDDFLSPESVTFGSIISLQIFADQEEEESGLSIDILPIVWEPDSIFHSSEIEQYVGNEKVWSVEDYDGGSFCIYEDDLALCDNFDRITLYLLLFFLFSFFFQRDVPMTPYHHLCSQHCINIVSTLHLVVCPERKDNWRVKIGRIYETAQC